jgi:O-antigen/teichoic acid export membrane protein
MSEGDPERPKDGRGRAGGGETFWTSRRWWRRTGHTAAGVWLANGLSILGTIVAARALGPGEYGAVLLALAAVNTVSIFLDVTFEEATNFYGNRALHDGDLGGLRALLRLSLKVDIAIGVVVTALVFALSGVLADLASAGQLDPTLVQISALSVLVTTADSTAFAALALARRVDLRARGLAATSAFRLIGVIIAVQLGGAEAVAVSYVLGGAAGSLVLAWYAWREGWRRWAPASGPEPETRPVGSRELVRFGFHSSLMTSVQAISGTLVPVILARAAGTAAVGVYRVARLPITAANTLQAPMRLAMFPEQSRLVAEGRMAEVRRSTKGYTLIAFGIGIVGAVVAYVAMPWLIPFLYSSSFESAVTPARIMLIAAVFNLAFLWRKTLLAALGRPEIRTRLVAVEVVVILSVLLPLADRGAEGAAIAASAGAVAAGLAWVAVARGLLADRPGPSPPRGRSEGPAQPPERTAAGTAGAVR